MIAPPGDELGRWDVQMRDEGVSLAQVELMDCSFVFGVYFIGGRCNGTGPISGFAGCSIELGGAGARYRIHSTDIGQLCRSYFG